VVVLVMAGACVAQAFGRFTYGVILPAVRDDLLGSSNGSAGFLGTVNVAAYFVGTIVVATVSARLTLVRLIRVGLCLSTSGLLLASFAGNAAALGAGLVLMGLGGAAIWIPSPRVASAALPPHRRGVASGLVGMGIGLGIVFAGQLSDAMRHGRGDDSWRAVYRIEGFIGCGVLVAAFVFLRHREAPTVGRPVEASPVIARSGFAGFGALRRIDGWLPLTAAYAAFGFMYLLVFAFFVARLEDDSGFTADRASSMFSVVGVAAVFGGVLLGALSDRFGRRRTLAASFVAFGLSGLGVLIGRQPWVFVAAIGVGLSFAGLPGIIAAYVVDATDAVTYGPAYSAATLAFGAAQAAAPQIGGLIADWQDSFTMVFVLSATIAAIGAVLSSKLPERRRSRVAASTSSTVAAASDPGG
jgi:MFS family permease